MAETRLLLAEGQHPHVAHGTAIEVKQTLIDDYRYWSTGDEPVLVKHEVLRAPNGGQRTPHAPIALESGLNIESGYHVEYNPFSQKAMRVYD